MHQACYNLQMVHTTALFTATRLANPQLKGGRVSVIYKLEWER